MKRSSNNLPTTVIYRAMETVYRQEGKLTGQLVRQFLIQHHGHPGSAARIYKLVAEFRERYASADVLDHLQALTAEQQTNAQLRAEIQQLKQQLEEAETREQSHSARWLLEIDSLRTRLHESGGLRKQLADAQDSLLQLRRELKTQSDQIELLQEVVRLK